ncbi:hypothetical protein ACFXPW_08330 [Streptomyces goshikiensis]|uniref:hypothetical protein n=1 Tax=Streptomyces goshikiensis TaxID=1942 RepID=UPI0036C94CC5
MFIAFEAKKWTKPNTPPRRAAARHSLRTTTPQDRPGKAVAFDAAAPSASALKGIAALGIIVPGADVLISYTHRSCIMRIADHQDKHRAAVQHAFWKRSSLPDGALCCVMPAACGWRIRRA